MATDPPEQQIREVYKFSPEELRVLRECNYESFYYRSLPFGTVFGSLAYYAVKAGYLKGSTQWGPVPKTLLGITAGYFIGKLSYQYRCAEKIMSLPDSRLADALRKRKGRNNLPFQEVFSSDPVTVPVPIDSDPNQHFESLQELRAEDRSYDAPPSAIGLDDTYRPSLDSTFSVSDQPLPPPSQATTSYDDLRRMNRQEYEQKRSAPYSKNMPLSAPPPRPAISSRSPSGSHGQKNAYGDVWEE